MCITDNKSLYDTLHTTNTIEDRSLRIDVGLLRQKIDRDELLVMHVKSKKQVADPFTKFGASSCDGNYSCGGLMILLVAGECYVFILWILN